jgi:hypothetical protein
MLYETPKREVETSSISSKEIKLKAGSKAFKILFGTIYKDIIKALVRELFTNAWDSHKDNDSLHIPVEIHAPSKYEPYFSIRDYGTGMSNEVINDTYSVVFASTKDKSNDQAGFMGMGSKTPLGYADSFSVISYVDGVYEAYQIYLNSEGNPVIDLQATGETTEANGVLVQVSVEDKDINHFNSMINNFVMTVDANVKVDGKKLEKAIDIGYKSKCGHYTYSSNIISGTYLKMGCVLYPLSNTIRDPDFDSSKRHVSQSNLNKRIDIVLDFPIGSFDVTASRDDIIYNDSTARLIKDAFSSFSKEYLNYTEKRINQAKSFIEANTIYIDNIDRISSFMFYTESKKLYWRGKKLTEIVSEDCFKTGIIDNFKKKFEIKKIKKNYQTSGSISRNDLVGVEINRSLNRKSIIIFDDGNNKHVALKVRHILNNIGLTRYSDKYIYVKGSSRKSLDFLLLSYKLGATSVIDIAWYTHVKPERAQRDYTTKIRYFSSQGKLGRMVNFNSAEKDEIYYIESGTVGHDTLVNFSKFCDVPLSEIMIKYKKDDKTIKKYPERFINIQKEYEKALADLKIKPNDIDFLVSERLRSVLSWSTKEKRKRIASLFLDYQSVDEKRAEFLDTSVVKKEFKDKIDKRESEVLKKLEKLITDNPYLEIIINTDRIYGDEYSKAIKTLLKKANIEIK